MVNCDLSETNDNKVELVFNILAYSNIIRYLKKISRDIQTYSEGRVIPVYSEPQYIQNRPIFRSLVYSEPCNIQNRGIFRTLAISCIFTVSSIFITLSSICDKEFCMKKVNSILNYFQTGRNYVEFVFNVLVYSGIIQGYSDTPMSSQYIQNPGIFRTLAYSELWYIQKLSIFRTVAYSEPWYIQNPGIFRTMACSET